MYKNFPKLSGILKPKDERQFARIAVCLSGKMLACNSHVMVELDSEKLFGLDAIYLEGKVLNFQTVQMLEKCKTFEFNNDHILIDSVKISYSGRVDDKRRVELDSKESFVIPDYSILWPENSEPKESVKLSPKLLQTISNCFKSDYVQINFYAGNNRPYIVYDLDEPSNRAILMPYVKN